MISHAQPKIVVISSPNRKDREARVIQDLLEAGLWRYHLRKPEWSADELRVLLNSIPAAHHSRIVIHRKPELLSEFSLAGYHLTSKEPALSEQLPGTLSRSFHDLNALRETQEPLDYVFLGPVFDSISKPGYTSAFHPNELRKYLHRSRQKNPSAPMTFALGGISLGWLSSHVQGTRACGTIARHLEPLLP